MTSLPVLVTELIVIVGGEFTKVKPFTVPEVSMLPAKSVALDLITKLSSISQTTLEES